MSLDAEALRADTPGCAHVAHFNHAGAALPPRPVLDAVVGHLELEARLGGYEAAILREEQFEAFYTVAASAIGADPSEIAWMDNASRGWALAVQAIGLAPGDRVVIAPSEFGTNVLALDRIARRAGAEVDVVPTGDIGDALDDGVRLVALGQLGAHLGEPESVADVGRLAHDAGALFLVDAAQAVGHLPVDVDDLGCDLLVATGRKWLRGPRGTAFLYVSAGVLDQLDAPVDIIGEPRTDARRFESAEHSVAGRLGLAAALEYALGLGLDVIAAEVVDRATALREELAGVPGLALRERRAASGIVTFTVQGLDPAGAVASLRQQGINLSAIPPTFAPHDLTETVFRASPHYTTTHTEMRALATALTDLRGGRRG